MTTYAYTIVLDELEIGTYEQALELLIETGQKEVEGGRPGLYAYHTAAAKKMLESRLNSMELMSYSSHGTRTHPSSEESSENINLETTSNQPDETSIMDIIQFAELIPEELLEISGKVFYSGRSAFEKPAKIYILGANPGGTPENNASETIGSHTNQVLMKLPSDWSAYKDESWEGFPPSTYGMAPRVLHMLQRLGLKPSEVPASNLFFPRSRSEAEMRNDRQALSDRCWPFHAKVINDLKPKVIVCFGNTAGNYVLHKLRANTLIREYEEKNNRRWKSRAYKNINGVKVVVTTHPSRADWTNPQSDPTELIEFCLGEA